MFCIFIKKSKGDSVLQEVVENAVNDYVNEYENILSSTRKKLYNNINNSIVSTFGAKVLKNITDKYSIGVQKKRLVDRFEEKMSTRSKK